jgi:hypothetical protein
MRRIAGGIILPGEYTIVISILVATSNGVHVLGVYGNARQQGGAA